MEFRAPTLPLYARRRAPWLVLWLGFGGLLVCILGAVTGRIVALDNVRKDETRIRRAFLGRITDLDQIRSHIYLSGTYVRDFLLSPDPSGAAAETSRLTALQNQSRTALDAYSRLLEANERDPFEELKSEI